MFTFTFVTGMPTTIQHGCTPPKKMKISSSLLAIQIYATQVHLEQWRQVKCEQSDYNCLQIFKNQQQIPPVTQKGKEVKSEIKKMAALVGRGERSVKDR